MPLIKFFSIFRVVPEEQDYLVPIVIPIQQLYGEEMTKVNLFVMLVDCISNYTKWIDQLQWRKMEYKPERGNPNQVPKLWKRAQAKINNHNKFTTITILEKSPHILTLEMRIKEPSMVSMDWKIQVCNIYTTTVWKFHDFSIRRLLNFPN